MKQPQWNSSVFVSEAGLAALQKKSKDLIIQQSKKMSLSGSGYSQSPFKTKGMDFSEVRPYQMGDDARQIDWRVTAKYGKPFTKLYVDERQRQIVFICDLRSCMKFASHGDFKSVIAAKMTIFLAWIAVHKNDPIRLVLMLPDMIKISPIVTGQEGVLSLIRDIVPALNPTVVSEDLISFDQMIKKIGPVISKGNSVFLCSDFHDVTPNTYQHMSVLSKRADISLIHIFDKMESQMPNVLFPVTDGKRVFVADMRQSKYRKVFADSFTHIQSVVSDMVRQCRLGYLPIQTNESYLERLAKYCIGGNA